MNTKTLPEGRQPSALPLVRWRYGDLAMAIAAFIVLSLIANIGAVAFADPMLDAGQKYEDNASALAIVLLASFVGQELFLLGAALWFGPRKYRQPLTSLGLREARPAGWLYPAALAVAGLVVIYGFVAVMSLLGVEEDDAATEKAFENAGPLLVIALGSIAMAPWIEEIFFRGFIFGGLQGRIGWPAAALLSGLLFGLAHLSLFALLPFTVVGLLFAWAYKYTGSIRPSIIAHLIINAVSLIAGFATSTSIIWAV